MPRYRANEHLPYFCTISVLDWLPVLIESRYIEPVIESLRFCRERRGLRLFAFVVMPNHMHLIAAGDEPNQAPDHAPASDTHLHALMRDFKRFTSRQIHDRLKEDGRRTVLDWLSAAGRRARRARDELGLWQDGFHPQALFTRNVFEQKLSYLHENPVRKGLVQRPEDWWYSSAGCYSGAKATCLDLDLPEF